MAQFGRPDSDIDNEGGWSPSSGSDLYAMLDESSASDSDYVDAPAFATSDSFTVSLTDVTDPSSSTGHVIRYRYRKDRTSASGYDLDVELLQGATVIASWSHVGLGTSWSDAVQTLSAGEADSITDYSDLRLKFIVNRTGGGSGAFVQVSWTEFECPDGGVVIAGNTGSLSLSGQQGAIVPGAVSVVANVGSLSFAGQQGAIVPGAVSIVTAVGALTLTGQNGGIIAPPPGGVVIVGNTGQLTLTGQSAAIVPGAVSIVTAVGVLTLTGQPGTIDNGSSISIVVLLNDGGLHGGLQALGVM